MSSDDYNENFPVGIQTVIGYRVIDGEMTFQVNTRYHTCWICATSLTADKVKQELIDQGKRFQKLHDVPVDTRYVKNWLR